MAFFDATLRRLYFIARNSVSCKQFKFLTFYNLTKIGFVRANQIVLEGKSPSRDGTFTSVAF